jgi:uncharacterized membrane protein (DUF2068 family)
MTHGLGRQVSGRQGSGGQHDRLLPWIAAERAVRSVVLVAVGVVLVTHPQADWGHSITRWAQQLGVDPSSNGIRRLSGQVSHLSPAKLRSYGWVAIGYGLLEAAEGYGLFRRRRWGEYLTVVATALLFLPEVDELVKKPSMLKVAAFILNAAIVAYLIVRLRRTSGQRSRPRRRGEAVTHDGVVRHR